MKFLSSLLCVGVTLTAATAAWATVPEQIQLEGAMMSSGGGPVADGAYDITVSLFPTNKGGAALWTEGPASLKVTSGRLVTPLGVKKAIKSALFAKVKEVWVEVQVGKEPPLPRVRMRSSLFAIRAGTAEAISCTGCLNASHLGAGAVAATKVGFTYAGSKTKGGPALDLNCTGCVSVAELKFDGDLDLKGNSIKAKNGVFTGSLSAASVTAASFVGDGSKLTGLNLPSGSCTKAGEVVQGINADGSLKCVAVSGKLPADGLDEVSNNLLSNQFVDAVATTSTKSKIPDNTGATSNTAISFPDIGLAQKFAIKVHVENTDLNAVTLKVLPPNDKKVGWVLCDPCGKKDEKVLKKTYDSQNLPKSGDLKAWIGANPKGNWNLVALDSAFCVPQAPGNKAYCDPNGKTDGFVQTWSIEIQTLSNKKVESKGLLITSGGLQLQQATSHPVKCSPELFGYIYANPKEKTLYACNGKDFAPISINDLGTEGNPAVSCKAIKVAQPALKSGTFWIDPDGPNKGVAPFETWCDQETDGGGWTLAIKGTMNGTYNGSFDKKLSDTKGFMKSFQRVFFSDVLVKPGDYKQTSEWASFHKVGNGNQTLDARIKQGGSGSYGVDYNVNPPHKVTARSKSLGSVSEWEALSLRMSQTSGPNDAMFFVVARENRAACNYYNGKRYVNSDCVAVQLGFRYNGYQWGSWQTVGWNTTCGESGYWNGSTTGCQSNGAVFVR